MRDLPKTTEDILNTGIMDPEFAAAWEARGSPPGDMPTDIITLKRIVEASLSNLQSQLAATRPANITETEHSIPLSTGFTSRLLICHATQDPSTPSPIILLFHGGIHVLGHPEFDLPLARRLALAHNATVLCPSTRKAPESPFPSMIDDAWAILQSIAHEASAAPTARTFLPSHADAHAGFIVGGASSGANFADVVAHLARDTGLSPPLTGQFLVCGAFIDHSRGVPAAYEGRYLSREQNRDAPVMNERFLRAFCEVIGPEAGPSRLWAPFAWSCSGGIAAGHKGMPKVYFQVCGMDINRDDSLIYEGVLREECGILTRLDMYSGFPHCWWDSYPELEASKRRMEDTIEGFRWLLARDNEG
ncbi:Alpha/Beta hydrolase protein [Achaetomium macrosporum]|uniref:Alpha/Beta hydrolase protein n=1 Tax=Achaetomium macrosporum TaxID=79813 RepID=A0AAN7C4F4_9PEZI|nr:Alpha/Beta hydrolase protein [Achaetomium macrosporum]